VTYAVASLACAWPLFVVAVVGSFTTHGPSSGVVDGLAYALGKGLVVCAVSLAGVGAQQLRLRWLRRAQPVLVRVAGGVMCLVGGYLVLYWVADAVSPTSTPGPVRVVESVQTTLARWLSASPRLAGVVIGAIVLVALGAASLRLTSRRGGAVSRGGVGTPRPGPADGAAATPATDGAARSSA
ncbi:MAG: hypothetical protein ACYCUG_14665, partial [Acidimicrobiales bacterium]